MKSMMKNKKGMSPLIATILLIAFAVALGAVVMNIGRSFGPDLSIGGSDGEVDCTNSKGLSILEVAGSQKICYSDNGAESFIDFTVSNSAPVNIDDLQIAIYGTQDVFNKGSILASPMKGGEGKRIKIKYDSTIFGSIEQVTITPKISDEKANVCNHRGITLDNIQRC